MVENTSQVIIRQKREILYHAIFAGSIIGVAVFIILLVMASSLGGDIQTTIQLYDPIFATVSFVIVGPADYYRSNTERLELIEKRLRTILTPIEIHLDSSYAGEPQFFRSPEPKWIDFVSGMVYLRDEIDEIIDEFEKKQSKEPLVLLCSKSGSGKTNLAYGLAYKLRTEFNEEYCYIYYENPTKRTSKLVSHTMESGDLVYYQLENIFQEIIDLLDESSRLKEKRVLIILDDIHRYYRVIAGLGRRISEYSHRISILLIARAVDLDIISAEWSQRLYDEPTDRLNINILGPEGYKQALQSITTSYLNFYNISIDSISNLTQVLVNQTGESLRLLSFILDEIPRINEIVASSDISSISICDRLDKYIDRLESGFVSAIVRPLDTRSSSLLKKNFREVVLCLAFFTQMEISIPIDSIPLLTNIKTDSVTNAVGYLKENGEIIIVDRESISLAAFDHMSFGKSLIKCHQSPDSLLSSTTFKYPDDYEIRCISLLEYVVENELESPLSEMLSFGNEEKISWNFVLTYLTKSGSDGGASLVPRLMDKAGAGFFGYLSKLPRLLQSDDVVAEILDSAKPNTDLDIVDSLVFTKDSDSHHILENEVIIDMIVKKLEAEPDDASFLLGGIMDHDGLVGNSLLLAAIAKAIDIAKYPWNLIKSISGNPEIMESAIVTHSIMNQKDCIAEEIMGKKDPSYVVFQIGRCEYLLENETISSAICDQIKQGQNPWSIIGLISLLNIGTKLPPIQEAISARISTEKPPQTILNLIGKNDALMENEGIKDSLSAFEPYQFWSSDNLGPYSEKLRDSMIKEGYEGVSKFMEVFMEQGLIIEGEKLAAFLSGFSSGLANEFMLNIAGKLEGKTIDDLPGIVEEVFKMKEFREALKQMFPNVDEGEFERVAGSPAFKVIFSTMFTETGIIPAMLDYGREVAEVQLKHFEKIAPGIAGLIEIAKNPVQIAIELRGANVLLKIDCIQEAFRSRALHISQEIEKSEDYDEIMPAILEIDSLKEHELIINAIESRKLRETE